MKGVNVTNFRIRGLTDDRTNCDCCGRVNLKCTVALEPVDADGNDCGPIVYYGRQCAAKAVHGSDSGRNVAKINRTIDELTWRNEANRWNAVENANDKLARIAFGPFVRTGRDTGFEMDCVKAAANYRYRSTNRPIAGSYFAERGGAVVRVDGADPRDAQFYEAEGFIPVSAPVMPSDL